MCSGGQAEGDESTDIVMRWVGLATGPQRHGRAKTESRNDDGKAELALQPIHASEYVASLGYAVVFAFAQAGAAKVEAQDGTVQPPYGIVQHLHGVVDNLVMQIAAAERVRMAEQRGETRMGRALIEDRFQ